MGIRKHVGAWLVISASKAARTTCRLFATSKVNAAACGHRLAQLHAGVMTDALSMIRNAAAASSTHQFQLGTPLEWFAVGIITDVCPAARMAVSRARSAQDLGARKVLCLELLQFFESGDCALVQASI